MEIQINICSAEPLDQSIQPPMSGYCFRTPFSSTEPDIVGVVLPHLPGEIFRAISVQFLSFESFGPSSPNLVNFSEV